MIKQVIEIKREEWQILLAHSSTASYFQSPECYDFYCSLSFLEPFGWGVWEGKELKALVIGYIIANGGKLKQFFSRRAIIHGGMLLANNVSEDAISELLGELKHSLSKQVIYIEIRNANSYINHKAIFAKHGFEYNAHHNYIVKTDTIEQVISRYSESKVRQLRNIQERGVVCVQTTCKNDIDRFYQILEDLYRKKIKKPLYPKEFFDKFVHQSGCYLFVVKNDEKIIGGIACSSLTDKAVYEWFICGDTKNFNHLYPSVLATHTGIEYAVKNGFEYFDFMGAERYGVREFKSKFGGELVEHGRFKYIVNPLLYAIGRIYIKLLTQEK
ncbi:MAG: FemAB family protein [Bacteroidetes bacterium ADurb.Bin174]|nr:MAG: FemAB family protein [Bacteroidetes bacterium ADurb.Bin174]